MSAQMVVQLGLRRAFHTTYRCLIQLPQAKSQCRRTYHASKNLSADSFASPQEARIEPAGDSSRFCEHDAFCLLLSFLMVQSQMFHNSRQHRPKNSISLSKNAANTFSFHGPLPANTAVYCSISKGAILSLPRHRASPSPLLLVKK